MAHKLSGRSLRAFRYALIGLLSVAAGSSPGFSGTMSLPGGVNVSPTGAASYSIPIALPPGTAGMAPTLSLEYSSQGTNGLLGVGWSLSGLPAITRCPRTRAQDGAVGGVNFDANDRFCMDGQRLVAISGAYGADGTQYRTEIESYSKIISHGTAGSGPAWFEVHAKSGQTMEFGNTTDSRILAQGKTSARVWAVNKVSDTKTNYFTATYTNDTTNGQFYPTRIDYTGNSTASVSPFNSVRFVYAARTVVPQYYAGSLAQFTVEMTNVQTYAGAALVSDYRLTYGHSTLPIRSQLTSIAVCDGSGTCLPATTINWTGYNAGFNARSQWASGYGVNEGWTNDGAYPRMFVDVNGDGLADIVGFASSNVYVSLSTGSGFASRQVWTTGWGVNDGWADGNTYPRMLVDVNGDGLADIVGFAAGGIYVALNTGSSFGARSLWVSGYGVNAGWSDNTQYPRFLADVNGDGLPDVVGFGGLGVYVSLNTGSSFGAQTLWVAAFGANDGWNQRIWNGNAVGDSAPRGTNAALPRAVIDVNGDGLPDVVGFGNSGVYVSLNTGSGFGTPTLWSASFGAAAGWSNDDMIPRMLADVNGDGLPDVVAFATASIRVALNTGTSFAPDQIWGGQNFCYNAGVTSSNVTPRLIVDVNGDGLPDAVAFGSAGVRVALNTGTTFTADQPWISGFGTNEGWTDNGTYPRMIVDAAGTGLPAVAGFAAGYVYVALNATTSAPPFLVSSVVGGLGTTTTVSYVPATNTTYVGKDAGTAFPWLDLVVPTYVVSRLDTSNGVGGTYSSNYFYRGGRIDTRGRGFLGYSATSVRDLQTNIVDTTYYRQDFPFTGLVSSTTRILGTQTLGQSTNTYQSYDTSGTAPYHVYLTQNVSSGADLDGSVLPTVTTSNQYDAYLNATQVTVSTADGFSKTTTNTYSNDPTLWYLGRLTRASVANVAP